ncbi:MAG TPA: DUF2178 domain-containing protein [Oleiagrimonas sp.]|nr:DUF2178 domain-containing protein [Oleiagrimonas sp.]
MKLPIHLAVLIVLSLVAFAALFSGFDFGLNRTGSAILLVGAWVIWYLLWKTLHAWTASDDDEAVSAMPSPGEWQAWIGLLFSLSILIYLSMHHSDMVAPDGGMSPAARVIGAHIVMLVISWAVVMQVLRKYWHDKVHHDERDRSIQARASRCARCVLTVFMIGLAVAFAFSSRDHLQWAQPMTLSNLLISGLILASVIEYLVAGLSYWHDRRGLAA